MLCRSWQSISCAFVLKKCGTRIICVCKSYASANKMLANNGCDERWLEIERARRIIDSDDLIFLTFVTLRTFLAGILNIIILSHCPPIIFKTITTIVSTCRHPRTHISPPSVSSSLACVTQLQKRTNHKQCTIRYPFIHLISSRILGALHNSCYIPLYFARISSKPCSNSFSQPWEFISFYIRNNINIF